MDKKKKNIFVVGLDDFNLEKLRKLHEARECEFLPAAKFDEIRGVESFDIPKLLDVADERIEKAGGIDAIVSYFDFPGTILVPIIAKKYNLPGPSIESVLKCEHKYWSRHEQKKVIPDNIPRFKPFDPFDDNAYKKITFNPPFWIKPVKSYHSYLAYKIRDADQFNEAMEEVRENIDYMEKPFFHIIDKYSDPDEFSGMKEKMYAETPIGGHQCTLEGYVFDDEIVVYGIIDSITEEGKSSFARYEYPSSLPQEVQFRMADIARKVIGQVGLKASAFNIEFFYDSEANEIYLLEINPRISQSHGDIFEKVHGLSNHHIMLNLALNQRPEPLENEGEFAVAAHFMLRSYHPGLARNVPGKEKIDALKKKYPEMVIQISVEEGTDLDDLPDYHIDSYSYVLANINLGGEDREDLLDKYNDVVRELAIKVEKK